jgi:hypothetical protein
LPQAIVRKERNERRFGRCVVDVVLDKFSIGITVGILFSILSGLFFQKRISKGKARQRYSVFQECRGLGSAGSVLRRKIFLYLFFCGAINSFYPLTE